LKTLISKAVDSLLLVAGRLNTLRAGINNLIHFAGRLNTLLAGINNLIHSAIFFFTCSKCLCFGFFQVVFSGRFCPKFSHKMLEL
jgi:hypothetical protein